MAALVVVGVVAVLALEAVAFLTARHWPGTGPLRRAAPRLVPSEPWRVVLAVASGASAYAIGLRLMDPAAIVYGGNDLSAHAAWAAEVRLVPFHPTQPHFGLHVLARIVQDLGVSSAERAVVVVAALLTAAGSWLVFGFLRDHPVPRPRSGWVAVATAVVVLGESPYVLVQLPSEIGRGAGYLTLHLWATPTNAVLLPTAMLLLPRLLDAVDVPLSWRRGAVVAALVAVAMVAKPAVPLVLVPAAFLLVAGSLPDWARVRARALPLLAWAAVPMLLVGVWQLRFLADLDTDRNGGVRLAPLDEMRIGGMLRPVAWLALLLPALLLLVAGGRWWRDRTVVFGGAAFVVGLLQFALLGESGYRREHANWGLGAYVGYLVLTVTALGYALQQTGGSDVRAAARARGVLAAAAIACGIAGLVALADSTSVGWLR